MRSYHLCAACRRTLLRVPNRQPLQWTPKASFISMSNIEPRATTDKNAESSASKLAGKDVKGWNTGLRPSNRSKRSVSRPTDHSPGDLLESLFEESLAPPTASTDIDTQPSKSSLECYHHAETLNKMLTNINSVGESWHFFLQHFGSFVRSANSTESRSMPSYLHTAAKQLLKQIIHAKSRHPFSKTLPSVSEVSWTYSKLGLLNGTDWADMALSLIETILKIRKQPSNDSAREKTLLMDLLGAWNVVCRHSGPPTLPPIPSDLSSFDWLNTPRILDNHLVQTTRKGRGNILFGFLTPPFAARHLDSVPLITVATFIFLEQDRLLDQSSIFDIKPFTSALQIAIKNSSHNITELFGAAHGPGVEAVSEFVLGKWPMVKDVVLTGTAPQGTISSISKAARHESFPSRVKVDIFRRLQTALAQRDGAYVDRLWVDAMQLPICSENKRGESSDSMTNQNSKTLTPGLCNHFIMAYMGLRKPNRAIDVWNHMINNGLIPDVRSWNSMLSGCKVARDRTALESLWARMQRSEVKPDAACWTTRISGLIDCGSPDAGLQALQEMGNLWLVANAQKRKGTNPVGATAVQNAVKPAVETVNAAIAGLLRRRKDEAAYIVLDWAGKFDIRPDIATFNTLLRPLIRDRRTDKVATLLQQMQDSGIRADTATFTIILDETFRSLGEQSPKEQLDAVNRTFAEMEQAGIGANIHLYSKVIYELLKISQGDMTAVNAVLDRMAEQGLHASAHIYTMLVEHYFATQPPSLDAVRSLIEVVRYKPGSTDNVFWDRVIEGYARAGETSSAMRMLGKLDADNNATGWPTLSTLLLALVQNQEWDLARTLVQNTKIERGGPISHDERGREGQHRFWALVAELKLV